MASCILLNYLLFVNLIIEIKKFLFMLIQIELNSYRTPEADQLQYCLE